MKRVNGTSRQDAEPTCYVLVAGKREAQRVYGPFENEGDATQWASENLPERLLFQIVPVWGVFQP